MKKFLSVIITLLIVFSFSGCSNKETVNYDFETYLAKDTEFERNAKIVMPSKDKLKNANIIYYLCYEGSEDVNSIGAPNKMIQLTVKYSDEDFIDVTQKLGEQSVEFDSLCEIEDFYYNGILYTGFAFYNYDARDDELDNYNDGYCAFAYNTSADSKTISYIAFESDMLQYMDMKSALELFPEFERKNIVVPSEN